MYYVWENWAAGNAAISRADQCQEIGPHFDFVGEFGTLAEAEAWIEEAREETRAWAVFFDWADGSGFVSREDCYSGNWRGSGYYPYNLAGEFSVADLGGEAKKRARALLAEMKTKCTK